MNIAVDMTPYIAGGANGGVVPLAIATINELAKKGNTDDYYILTTGANYDSLAFMESTHIKRVCIDGPVVTADTVKSVEAEVTPASVNTTPTVVPGPNAAERCYLKIRAFGLKVLPERCLNYLRRHRRFFANTKNVVFHPIRRLLKPAIKWIIPHGIYEIIHRNNLKKLQTPQTIIETHPHNVDQIITPREGLCAITGCQIDLLFCPFTSVDRAEPGIPVVSQLNDIQHKYCPWFFKPEELAVRDSFYDSLVAKKPFIISISEYTRKSFLESYNYPEDQIVTIHPAVQDRLEGFSRENDTQLLKELGLSSDNFFLYPANFWPHKNHRGLITAFGMFCSRHPDNAYRLVLTGFPVEGNSYWIKTLKKMNLENRVDLLGYVSDAQLAALFRGCRFMIFPSLFEGFGIPVTEAMNMGTTVLCSNVTSLPEVGGDCAFYFDPYDPQSICNTMEFVLTHPDEVQKKKEEYSSHLKKFSKENYISKIEEVFTTQALSAGVK